MKFYKLENSHTGRIAELHIQGISTGFISSLGIDFVTALYEAIAQSKFSFGFVAEENNKILGFVAFATNINKLYKSVILKEGWRFAFLSAGKMFSLRRMKKVLQTLFYASRIKKKMDLPSAELLSIVVAEQAQGKGIGKQLLERGFRECAKRDVDKVKVLVGANNEPAIKLYLKFGFELAGQFDNHGILSNIYVASTCTKEGQ